MYRGLKSFIQAKGTLALKARGNDAQKFRFHSVFSISVAEGAAVEAETINPAMTELKQKSEGVVSTGASVSAVVEENTTVAEQMVANSQEVTTAEESSRRE